MCSLLSVDEVDGGQRLLGGDVVAGVLVGLAMAIKLTPGVFVIHYLLNKRWRDLKTTDFRIWDKDEEE